MSNEFRMLNRQLITRDQPCIKRVYVSSYNTEQIISSLKANNVFDEIEYTLLDSPLRIRFGKQKNIQLGISYGTRKPEYVLCIMEKEMTIVSLVWIESTVHLPLTCSQMDSFIKNKLSAVLL